MTMEKIGAVPSSEVPVPKPGESGIKQKAEAGSYFIRLLQQRLDDLQPEKISPRWIELTDTVLYKELSRDARTPEGKVDWQRIVSHLSPQWQAAWKRGEEVAVKSKKHGTVRSLAPHLKEVMKAAEEPKQPEKIERMLPPEPQVKRMERTPDDLEGCIKFLVKFLEEEQPKVISPIWVWKNHEMLARRFRHLLPNEGGGIQWSRVKESLPPEWQARWKERVPDDLEGCMRYLVKFLERERPNIIGPSWVWRNQGNLAKQFGQFFPDGEGGIDWPRVKEMLPAEWQAKWVVAKRLEDFLPTETYTDQQELDEAIAPYKENFYSFASLEEENLGVDHELQKQLKRMAEKGNALAQKRLAESQIKPRDIKEMRNTIAQVLVKLAQKGNTLALEKLSDLLEPLVQTWLDEEAGLAAYKHNPERLKQIFERCVYLDRGNKDVPFLNYFKKSLGLEAKGLKHQEARSLDAEMGESGQNLLDRLGTYQEPNFEGEEGEEEEQEQEVYTFGKKSGPTVKAA
ncbi:MAG: hypothetical protein PHC53_02455 [Patescibacteria group bacterium]|nr:hypothetical protein [Patescibacteria group bacterium]